jgi:uncharacterized membrane protein YhhN
MPRASTALTAAGYAALAAADSYLAGRTSPWARRGRFLVKPGLMPTLAAAFTQKTDGRASMLRNGTVAAQAFSWGGDVALLGSGDRAFLTGVGSFFGAHVCYLAAFLSARGEREDFDTTGLKVALGLLLTGAPAMGFAAGRQEPKLRVPVAAYAAILSAMFASSRMLGPRVSAGARRRIRAGTTLFLVSDSILGVQKFLLGESHPALETAVMATYTAGQGLIAAGVAGA